MFVRTLMVHIFRKYRLGYSSAIGKRSEVGRYTWDSERPRLLRICTYLEHNSSLGLNIIK